MPQTRRTFLGQTLLAGAALGFSAAWLPRARKRILILGGTGFLGPKTVAAALARGHQVTIFNRGKTEKRIPFEFQGVEHLYGNRDPLLPADDERGPDGKLLHPDATPKGLDQLVGREWDAVIDNSGQIPRHVKASAELLAKSAGLYVYISSISAYARNDRIGGDESTELAVLADPTVETMGAGFENYGGLKALCEQAAAAAFPGRAAVIRPGFIVGPGDSSDRFSYWPLRISRGGEVLAPGSPEDPVQWIDVRDLGEWLVKLVEDGTSGSFNAIGPDQPARWGAVLEACVKAAEQPATLTWVAAEWLRENGQDDFPIWVPPAGEYAGFHRWSNERAKAAGLSFRPVDVTIRDILDWFPGEVERRARVTRQMQEEAQAKGLPPPRAADPAAWRAGPSPAREQELLALWKKSQEQEKRP